MSGKRLTTASTSPLARSNYVQDETITSPGPPAALVQPAKANIDDDDELLVAARQVRQAMTESISLFQEEIAKDELHQFKSSKMEPLTRLSKSLGAQDWRAMVASFASFAPVPNTERTSKFVEPPPRYRSRVSKFLPRERHSDVQAARRRTIGTRSRGSTPNSLREAALEAALAEKSAVNGVKAATDEPILLDDDDVEDPVQDTTYPSIEQSRTTQPMAIDPQLTQFGPTVNGSSNVLSNHQASFHTSNQVFDLDDDSPVAVEQSAPATQDGSIPVSENAHMRSYTALKAVSPVRQDKERMVPKVPSPMPMSPVIASLSQAFQSNGFAAQPARSASPQPQLFSQASPPKSVTLDPRERPIPPAAALPSPPEAVTQDPRKRPSPSPSRLPLQAPPPKPAPRDPRQRPPTSVAIQSAPKAAPPEVATRDPRQRPSQPVQSPKLKMQPKKPPPRRQVSAPHVNPFALLEGMGDDDDEEDKDEDEEENHDDEAADIDVIVEHNPGLQNNTFVAANAMQQLHATAHVNASDQDATANQYPDPSQLDAGMWENQTAAKDKAGYEKYFSESEDDREGEGYEYDDAGMGSGGEVAFDDDEGEDEDEDEEEEEDFDEDDEEDDESMEEDDEDEPQGGDRAAAWQAANGGKSGASVEDAIEL